MNESVLKEVKKLLGLGDDYTPFDVDVILLINGAIATLTQIAIPEDRRITDENTTWSDLFYDCPEVCEMAKTYIFLKTKIAFDPPTNSFLVASIESQIKELEWRLEVKSKFNDQQEGIIDAV